ncbi:MAG: DUF481 domain-containing protein [Gemmatimonadota bacterium]|nr:DUF481 domain-containing protein [Gemmatimonadota bacterium]
MSSVGRIRYPHPFRRAVRAAALAAVCSSFGMTAEGQILNTLRGWADPEPGLTGEVEGRFGLAEGNSDYLELSAGGAIQLVTGRHRVRFLVSETLRRADGEEIAENFLLHLRHNYRLTAGLSSLLFAQNQFNPFRRLERRTLLGAGARFDIVREAPWNASLGASYMFESERLTDAETEDIDIDHRGSFFVSVIGSVTESVGVDVSGFYQPRLDDFSDSRVSLDASAQTDLVGELDLIVAFALSRESEPAPGVEETDLTLTTGLRFSF